MHPDIETPVLIIGAGPAGLTTALALTQYGTEHLIIERHPGTAHTPRAHIVNQRTSEIMRHLGVEDDLKAVASPHDMMRHSIYYTTLNRPEIARYECWGTERTRNAEYSAVSPSTLLNCPQTRFEPMLVSAIDRNGSEVRFNHEFLTMVRDGDGWLSTIRDRTDGSTYLVRSRFVVGADGARTKVLGLAGLHVEGPAGLFSAANIWFTADLTRFYAHRPGVLSWNLHPSPDYPLGLGTIICHQPFHEFVLVLFYDQDTEDLTQMSSQDATRCIERAIGEPLDDIRIKGIAGWQVNAQVAPLLGRDNVFCLGDAIHRHPPTNGLGLNMSVADAYNLAWKLALVVRGNAGPALLDTYHSERQPVDAAGVDRAIRSLYQAAGVRKALGIEPGMSEEQGWAALALLDDPSPQGDQRRAALRTALAETDYRFNALGLESGYRYDTGALIAEPDPQPPEVPVDPVLHVVPSTRPGERIPHARIERDGLPLSTLDLIDGLEFALIIGLDGHDWHAAAASATARTGITIRVHHVGGPEILDPYYEWADVREVTHSGAVLVRPDRHIAWRAATLPENPTQALTDALTTIMRLDSTPAARHPRALARDRSS